jgi:hypothetical protein
MLFNYFMDNLSHDIAIAEKEGRYSDVIRDLYGDKNMAVTHLSSHDIYTNPITSATCTVHELKVDKGFSWEQALARLRQAQKDADPKQDHNNSQDGPVDFKGGFYETKNLVLRSAARLASFHSTLIPCNCLIADARWAYMPFASTVILTSTADSISHLSCLKGPWKECHRLDDGHPETKLPWRI